MAIATQRREGESSDKLIQRWKRKTQRAGLVKQVRAAKHFRRKVSKTKQREIAIVREGHREKRRIEKFYS